MSRGRSQTVPIAVIGVGCRFPGAASPEAFWQLIRNGVDAITEVPPDRWDVDAYYDPDPDAAGKMYTRWGGFLDRVDRFDRDFFGISPREAVCTDPQQRLLLEVAWEALEDAGQTAERLAGSATGVFVGISANDYRYRQQHPSVADIYTTPGNAFSIAANRISFLLDLRGPSMAVDTACSSSLLAAHLACQSLWRGESTLALAGGVNAILSPGITINLCQARMLSPGGRCRAFDAGADGYVRGEGVGVLVLKPLARALADGDPVHAVIRGSASNQDGRTSALTVPNQEAQEAVVLAACRQAGVSPGEIDYVEAHGTGTPVGDPVEARALGTVLAIGRRPDRPCPIGSVKTNIGHLESAAGVAGLIKAVLMLEHRQLPPSLHFRQPNPKIPFDELAVRVQRTLEPWPERPTPLLAGVNSFGFGGANAHLVLAQAPGDGRTPAVSVGAELPAAEAPAGRPHLLPISARSAEALPPLARAYRELLAAGEDDGSADGLADLCDSATLRRSHHEHRLVAVGRTRPELVQRLDAFLQGHTVPGLATGRAVPDVRPPKLAFVFCGQGPQSWSMGRELKEREPVFREALERCDELFRRHAGWSVLEEMAADWSRSRMDETACGQAALLALQVALAELWRSWGVVPDAVVGHSVGEPAAAWVAGVLELEEAVEVIYHRGRLMQRATDQGRMAAVELSAEQAEEAAAGHGDRLSVATCNSPSSTVLSGDPEALEEVLRSLERQGVFCRRLDVRYAFHSHQMEPFRDELAAALAHLRPRRASIPIYSTLLGRSSDGREYGADYWARQLRERVLFAPAVDELARDGHELFLELGPRPVLAGAIVQCLRERDKAVTVLPSLRREEDEQVVMLSSLGALHAHGRPLDWERLRGAGKRRYVRLPPYPWQQERCWLETREDLEFGGESAEPTRQGSGAAPVHPFLRRHWRSVDPGWDVRFDLARLPYLGDHRIQGTVVLPATAFIESALAAADEVFGLSHSVLSEVEFTRAVLLGEGETRFAQAVVTPDGTGPASFRLYSRDPGGGSSESPWVLNASARIRLEKVDPEASVLESGALETVRSRCRQQFTGRDLYAGLEQQGLEYGPCFQGIQHLWRRDGEALAQLWVPRPLEPELEAYQLHPAVLDAGFHALAAALPAALASDSGGGLYLPVRIGSVRVYGRPGSRLWSHARLRSHRGLDGNALEGEIRLLDEEGGVVAEVVGLRLQRLDSLARHDLPTDPEDWLYAVRWEGSPLEGTAAEGLPAGDEPAPPHLAGSWLIFADGGGVGRQLAELLRARGARTVVVSPSEGFRRTYRRPDREYLRLDPADPGPMRRLLAAALGPDQPPCRGVVHLWSLDAAPPAETTAESLAAAQQLSCASLLHFLHALGAAGWETFPRLWVVTREAEAVAAGEPPAVAQAPVRGLGRVVANEHPELACTLVDLGPGAVPGQARQLLRELWTADREDQIAWRGEERSAPRLVHWPVEGGGTEAADAPRDDGRLSVPQGPAYRLEIVTPGLLDSLRLRTTGRRIPGPEEVEIQVHAAGLNFRDVLKATNLYPPEEGVPLWLGDECAGRIVARGREVREFEVGDEVIALAPFSLAAFCSTVAPLVVPKPSELSFEEAATVPVTFLTAYYGLHHLARLRPGERVLIHAAAGGVGLAAVQVARWLGAEIYATAGSDEKRRYLRSLGVRQVMNSRSLSFADRVLELTGGWGVDVVLNSLAGDAIARGLSSLGPFGRFVELGKRDIFEDSKLGLLAFQNNISFHAVDLSQLFRERPEFGAALLREVMEKFADGTFRPLAATVFPLPEVPDAFRHMAQAKHIGKIVISMPGRERLAAPAADGSELLRPDAGYLISGGLGGLGLEVAQWMVRRGARHLALLGRSGASESAQPALERMAADGARVSVLKADVAEPEQVSRALAEIERSMPPLAGVIHAAGMLDDGALLQLDARRFRAVTRPKIEGAWQLHAQTLDAPLDFFVLFSSATSLLGSPGQGNYAAGNAFLDALAHYRRAQGRPGLSINWGAWAEAGMASRTDAVAQLAVRGMGSLDTAVGLEILGRLLAEDATQIGVLPADWPRWSRFLRSTGEIPLLRHLARGRRAGRPRAEGGLTRADLLATPPEDRQGLLESYMQKELAKVLQLEPERLDPKKPLNVIGLDSLMIIEIKTRVETDFEITLPTLLLLQDPTISGLASRVLELSAGSAPEPAEGSPAGAAAEPPSMEL